METEWILCPICGNKTRNRIREDTELKHFPLYRVRRSKAKEQGIEMYHYDNLIDLSKSLEEKNTF